ncbi:olfactory receptor 51G2-like [Pleurodeles waltl]|uniref:olfactory receptor 51G2-like n=1 Tax=Pleurodeles waltl TaxID=8319 RepID=UPI003709994E
MPLHFATLIRHASSIDLLMLELLNHGTYMGGRQEQVACEFLYLPPTEGHMFVNNSDFHHSSFILTGLPNDEPGHLWISTLICFLYALMILGNASISYIIKTNQSLHAPMFYLLSVLAVADIALAFSTLPTMIKVFLLKSREIHIDACLCQIYFMNMFTFVESGVLLAMALDRVIAICDPLRYTTILTNSTLWKIGWSIALRAIVLILPEPLLDRGLPFCRTNVLTHPWCLHQEIIKLACADITVHSSYGLFVVSTLTSDAVLIVLSYILILRVVLRIASQKERNKSLSTCMSHIWAVFLFYMPTVGLSVLHRLGSVVPPLIYKVLAYIFYLAPPVMNPLIYCFNTKQIRTGNLRLVYRILSPFSRSLLVMLIYVFIEQNVRYDLIPSWSFGIFSQWFHCPYRYRRLCTCKRFTVLQLTKMFLQANRIS